MLSLRLAALALNWFENKKKIVNRGDHLKHMMIKSWKQNLAKLWKLLWTRQRGDRYDGTTARGPARQVAFSQETLGDRFPLAVCGRPKRLGSSGKTTNTICRRSQLAQHKFVSVSSCLSYVDDPLASVWKRDKC